MMTLKQVKDWMKQHIDADNWKIGIYDNSKQKTICVRSLAGSKMKIAIGGLDCTNIYAKGISIIVHWNKNPDASEIVAKKIHALFYGKSIVIDNFKIVKCDMRNDEPVSVGTDDNGVYEYVIELWMTYEKTNKED